jgi:tetratricopeptide (TPR) repeat protein
MHCLGERQTVSNTNHISRLILATALIIGSSLAVVAQVDRPEIPSRPEFDRTANLGSVRGRVVLPGGGHINSAVRVSLYTFRDTVASVYTDNQGQFEFSELFPGNYQVEVEPTDRERFEPSTDAVQVFRRAASVVTLTLKARDPRTTKHTKPTISVSELARDVPAKAKKEFEKAGNAARKGSAEEAIVHLRKAIEIYPRFVLAHNDLGVQLLALGRLDEAREVLERAVRLDRTAFNPALNLGIVLVHLHRFAEGNEILAHALKAQPNSAAARLYSGLALKGLNDAEAAERELKAAYDRGGTEYAVALFYLGQLHLSQGNRAVAREYLERYLNEVPNATNADQVRETIARLRK